MKEHNRHIDNNSLDILLRKLLLEEKDIHFTQKEMDMNAAIVFSSQPGVAISGEKEKVLISDLERLLGSPGGKRSGWFFTIALLLIGSSLIYFITRNQTTPTSGITEKTNQHTVETSPVYATQTTSDPGTDEVTAFTAGNFSDTASKDSVLSGETKREAYMPLGGLRNGNPTRMHIPDDFGYEEYPFVATDPVFAAKPSPDNFKVVKGTFNVDTFHTGRSMFSTKDGTVSANYYEGEPFKSGMGDFQYVNYGEYSQKGGDITQLPWQVLCYADTNDVSIVERELNGNKYGNLALNAIPDKGVRLATQPFYFRKYEVTNYEYREFLQWVRASNGYANKPITRITIDTIPVTDPNDKSGEQITIKGNRFKIKRTAEILEDYAKVYRYIFFSASDELLAELGSQSLNVFPDTLSWIDDFIFSYNGPMSNMYRWHPAYNDYPVVGVSWFQAMAFLDWATYIHQKQFDAEGTPYVIEYSLPSDIEWELVTMMHKNDGKHAFDFTKQCSGGWMTNLGVSYSNDDAYDRPDYLKNLFTKDQYYQGDYIRDGYFHTGPARLAKNAKEHVGPMDINWLDGNVSEWMMESYSENWKPFFEKHMVALSVDNRETTRLAKQIELLYDKGNAKNGRLVRGANWYDERFGSRPGSELNEAGISPRRYIDPREQHCTVGFRFVVRVRYKDEAERLQ